MTRESMYDAKVVLFIQLQQKGEISLPRNVTRRRCVCVLTHTNAERILPIMVIRRIFLRPYLRQDISVRHGAYAAHENTEPMRPPLQLQHRVRSRKRNMKFGYTHRGERYPISGSCEMGCKTGRGL